MLKEAVKQMPKADLFHKGNNNYLKAKMKNRLFKNSLNKKARLFTELVNCYLLKRLHDFVHVNKLRIIGFIREINVDSPYLVRRHFLLKPQMQMDQYYSSSSSRVSICMKF
jgi:hypothetical protein